MQNFHAFAKSSVRCWFLGNPSFLLFRRPLNWVYVPYENPSSNSSLATAYVFTVYSYRICPPKSSIKVLPNPNPSLFFYRFFLLYIQLGMLCLACKEHAYMPLLQSNLSDWACYALPEKSMPTCLYSSHQYILLFNLVSFYQHLLRHFLGSRPSVLHVRSNSPLLN
jgi:hypothetical protein